MIRKPGKKTIDARPCWRKVTTSEPDAKAILPEPRSGKKQIPVSFLTESVRNPCPIESVTCRLKTTAVFYEDIVNRSNFAISLPLSSLFVTH
jgi:hypothetical protein